MLKLIKNDRIYSQAAELSFYFILSILPLLSIFAFIMSLFVSDLPSFFSSFFSPLPTDVKASFLILMSQLEMSSSFSLFHLIILFWSSSRVVQEVRQIFHPKMISNEGFFGRLRSIFLVVLLFVQLLGTFLLLSLKNFFLEIFGFSSSFFWFIDSIVSIGIFILLVSSLYYFADGKTKYKNTLKGSLFFAVSYVVLSWVFPLYGHFFFPVGTFGLFFILSFFSYILFLLFLFGERINRL